MARRLTRDEPACAPTLDRAASGWPVRFSNSMRDERIPLDQYEVGSGLRADRMYGRGSGVPGLPKITRHTIHLDSRFRNTSAHPDPDKYTIQLPVSLRNIKRVTLLSLEAPNTSWNVEAPHNAFWLYESDAANMSTAPVENWTDDLFLRGEAFAPSRLFRVTIPEGSYTTATLIAALHTAIPQAEAADGSDASPAFTYNFELDPAVQRMRMTASRETGSNWPTSWCALVAGGLTRRLRLTLQRGHPRRQTILRAGREKRSAAFVVDTSDASDPADVAALLQRNLRAMASDAGDVRVVHTGTTAREWSFLVAFPVTPNTLKGVALSIESRPDMPVTDQWGFGEAEFADMDQGFLLPGASVVHRLLGMGKSRVLVAATGAPAYFPESPDLTAERYMVLRCPELGNMVLGPPLTGFRAAMSLFSEGSQATMLTDVFAKVPLAAAPGSLGFVLGSDSALLGDRVFDGDGLPSLDSLRFEWTFFDGSRVNFRGVEHSMMLRVDTIDSE